MSHWLSNEKNKTVVYFFQFYIHIKRLARNIRRKQLILRLIYGRIIFASQMIHMELNGELLKLHDMEVR